MLGARRWIKIGPMHFQPSEWVKLILILVVARYFANLGGREPDLERDFQGVCAGGRSHAAGADHSPTWARSLTYTPILIVGLFLGGINVRQALILITAGLVLVAGAWNSGKVLKPYQKARLTSFINPDDDPKGAGYQIRQS